MFLKVYFEIQGNLIPLMSYLNFSWIVFIVGLVGIVWNKKDILLMIFCIELVFFSIGLNFIFISNYTFQPIGQIYCLLIVTVAASETAIGLGLLITILRLSNKISYDSLITLRG